MYIKYKCYNCSEREIKTFPFGINYFEGNKLKGYLPTNFHNTTAKPFET